LKVNFRRGDIFGEGLYPDTGGQAESMKATTRCRRGGCSGDGKIDANRRIAVIIFGSIPSGVSAPYRVGFLFQFLGVVCSLSVPFERARLRSCAATNDVRSVTVRSLTRLQQIE